VKEPLKKEKQKASYVLEKGENGMVEVRFTLHDQEVTSINSSPLGSGVCGWETQEEEDIWEAELDFLSPDSEDYEPNPLESDMTVGELMEWRYIRAEREKEQVLLVCLLLI
jgi:hypothetical protein